MGTIQLEHTLSGTSYVFETLQLASFKAEDDLPFMLKTTGSSPGLVAPIEEKILGKILEVFENFQRAEVAPRKMKLYLCEGEMNLRNLIEASKRKKLNTGVSITSMGVMTSLVLHVFPHNLEKPRRVYIYLDRREYDQDAQYYIVMESTGDRKVKVDFQKVQTLSKKITEKGYDTLVLYEIANIQ